MVWTPAIVLCDDEADIIQWWISSLKCTEVGLGKNRQKVPCSSMKSNITTARRVHFTPFQASSTWCGPPPSPTGCPILLVSSPHRWHVKSLRLGIELVGDDFAPSTYISFTPTFKYLGTVVSWDLRECNDVQARIKAANKLFGSAKATFWSNSRVPL